MDESTCMQPFLLFNKTIDQMRAVGSRGGRAHSRNLRAQRRGRCQAQQPAVAPDDIDVETIAEAVALLDARFPWLVGAERRRTGGHA